MSTNHKIFDTTNNKLVNCTLRDEDTKNNDSQKINSGDYVTVIFTTNFGLHCESKHQVFEKENRLFITLPFKDNIEGISLHLR